MKPRFPLRWTLAIVSFYAFVTILFLDGNNRDDAGSPPRIAEKATRLPAPGAPFSSN